MSKPMSLESASLLNAFVQTYETIMRDGTDPYLHEKDPCIGKDVKRIGPIFAVALAEDVRALAVLDGGMVAPFAKVNGKGYVENVEGTPARLMAELVYRGVVPAKPSTPEKSNLTHHSVIGEPVKVL